MPLPMPCHHSCSCAHHSHEEDGAQSPFAVVVPCGLQTEYKTNPLGMDEPRPRFAYQLKGAVRQEERQVQVFPAGRTQPVWDTGWEKTGLSQQIVYQGAPLEPFQRYHWRVRIKDETGKACPWSPLKENYFETGFLGTPWKDSSWIGFWGGNRVNQHPQLFFREFDLPAPSSLASARLYVTALGCYEAELNGTVVSWPLAPGWTAYRHRTQYQAYDVKECLKKGRNILWLTLASGWYDGRIAGQWNDGHPLYGEHEAVRAELHLAFQDGSRQVLGTDATFQTAQWGGAIRMSDIYDGELCQGWRTKEMARQQACTPAGAFPKISVDITWNSGPQVARLAIREPVSITRRCQGTYVVDFGQNFTGREILRLKNTVRGATITVKHGEMLEEDGSVYVTNLRGAKAMTTYICDTAEETVYEPTFTFYGFRYLEVSGWPGRAPTRKDITAAVLSSDLKRTGLFMCSHDMVNRLFDNVGWGLRSNLLDVPTDCPQRDERFGWTGDTQVVCNAATYCLQAPDFYTKWLIDLNLDQFPNGNYPNASPNPKSAPSPAIDFPGPAWQDAAIIVPWQLYRKYGDARVLERHFHQMDRYLQYVVEYSKGTYVPEPPRYGDWLNLDAPTSNPLIATAYLAGMLDLLSRMAGILGRTADQERLARQARKAKKAFQARFVDPEKGLVETTQCALLLALHFDLLPPKWVQPSVDALVKDIRENRDLHLSTGFVGTPLLLPVLSRFGQADLAYDLLLQTSYPGWLYPITQGATTMWERWNSYTKEGGFGDMNMNSFNHYAYGAVAEWFFESICGIQPIDDDPAAVAFKRFRLAPQPGKPLDSACAVFVSPYGVISSAWERKPSQKGSQLLWNFFVPYNTTAEITLPPGKVLEFSGNSEFLHDDRGGLLALPGEYTILLQE